MYCFHYFSRSISFDQFFPFTCRPHPADRQLVVFQPPNHIEIYHRDGLVERKHGILNIKARTEKALFLAAECYEDDRAFIPFCDGELTCKLDDRGDAGCIVVGAVMYLGRVCRQAALPAVAEVVVMRADYDR